MPTCVAGASELSRETCKRNAEAEAPEVEPTIDITEEPVHQEEEPDPYPYAMKVPNLAPEPSCTRGKSITPLGITGYFRRTTGSAVNRVNPGLLGVAEDGGAAARHRHARRLRRQRRRRQALGAIQ